MSYIGVPLAARKASLDSGGDVVISNLIVTSNLTQVIFGPLGEDYLFGVFLGGNLDRALLTLRRVRKELNPILEG